MTTTNPVSMSVLPTDGQCLIEDGTNVFTVAGQLSPASSFVDSYQLCDPDGICLVAGVAGTIATIDELESRAFALLRDEKYAEAAEAYEALGRAQENRRAFRPAVLCYETAASAYRRAGNLPKAADAHSSAARMAMKIGNLDSAFDLAGSAVNAYLEVAKTTGTKENKFEWYQKAYALLLTQAEIVHADGGVSTSRESFIIEKAILEMQLQSLEGARLNNPKPTFGSEREAGIAEFKASLLTSARVYRRLGNAYERSGKLDKAANAYFEEYNLILRSGEEDAIAAFRTFFGDITGEITATAIQSALEREAQKLHVMVVIAKLAGGGSGEKERIEETVRKLGELHHSGQMDVAGLLDDESSWLSEALSRVLKEDFRTTFKTRVKAELLKLK